MKNYCALVINGIVNEIIVAEFEWVQNNLDGDWHDLGEEPLTVAVGWLYDPNTNTFTPPPQPEPDVTP
jgi:hypothetical protein